MEKINKELKFLFDSLDEVGIDKYIKQNIRNAQDKKLWLSELVNNPRFLVNVPSREIFHPNWIEESLKEEQKKWGVLFKYLSTMEQLSLIRIDGRVENHVETLRPINEEFFEPWGGLNSNNQINNSFTLYIAGKLLEMNHFELFLKFKKKIPMLFKIKADGFPVFYNDGSGCMFIFKENMNGPKSRYETNSWFNLNHVLMVNYKKSIVDFFIKNRFKLEMRNDYILNFKNVFLSHAKNMPIFDIENKNRCIDNIDNYSKHTLDQTLTNQLFNSENENHKSDANKKRLKI